MRRAQPKEKWKDISLFEGSYQVSDNGRVRSLPRKVTRSTGAQQSYPGMVLNPRPDKDGYLLVTLWKEGARYDRKIHRLVAQVFLNNEQARPEVNHLNGIRSDNRLCNLEWASYSENRLHSYATLKRKVGTERKLVATHLDTGEQMFFESVLVAKKQGYNRARIYECLAGESRHHRNFLWSYNNGA
jgi:hypothetical protein